MKKAFVPVVIIIIVGIAAIAAAFYGMFFLGMGSTYYYTKIDNTKYTTNNSGGVVDLSGAGGFEHMYTITSYNDKGKEKELVFGTSKQLREGAYIRLTVYPMRGVVEWEEMQGEELPKKVQEIYSVHPIIVD